MIRSLRQLVLLLHTFRQEMSEKYAEPVAYWSDQPIYKTIVDYSKLTPANNTSPYYYDGRNAIGTQIQNIMNGADTDSAIADAQAEVEFSMQ